MTEQRLIDANFIHYEPMLSARGNGQYEDVMVAYKDQIDDMPTIEERKTGKWVRVHGFATPGGDPVWCCSECGKGVHVYGVEHGTYGADISDGQWKACPNCSALMEGEQI